MDVFYLKAFGLTRCKTDKYNLWHKDCKSSGKLDEWIEHYLIP